MDDFGMKENDAFTFIRSSAMRQRINLREAAQQVLDGTLVPDQT